MESAPEEANFDNLSIEECLGSSNWRARQQGYERLSKEFRLSPADSAPIFRRFDPDALKRVCVDSNVAAQEKGVECVYLFVEFANKPAVLASRDTVLPGVVDKCLGSTRASIKTKAIELCLLYVEVEGNANAIVPHLLEGLKAKQPKVVAACVTVSKELVKQFGVKIVPMQQVLKALPAIFGHADKAVRAEGALLVQECYRYLGSGIESFLSALKPLQLKELQVTFQELDAKGSGAGTGQQARLTRDQQRDQAIKQTESTLGGQPAAEVAASVEQESETMDPSDFAEPVQIKLPPEFFEKLGSSKWKERKEEALDPLLKVLQVPKIADSDYGELVRALAGRMADANVACVTVAANCLEALAKGLREQFDRYRSSVVAPVLERFKERKQSVVDALASCLDAVAATIPFSDLVEDICNFSKHKNPQVKSETLRWLVRSLKDTRQAPTAADVKAITTALVPALEDGFEPVRGAAQEAFGTLMKIIGERPFAAQMESMDDLRKAKIKEFFEKAQVKAKSSAAGAPSARLLAPPLASAAPAKAGTSTSKPVQEPKEPPSAPSATLGPTFSAALSRSPSRKPPKAKAAPTTTKKDAPSFSAPKASTSKAAASPSSAASEPVKSRYSQEEAEAYFANVLPAQILAGLDDANWKNRLAATESLQQYVEADSSVESELIVRCLFKRPGWKESNFQVYTRMFQIFRTLNETSASWSKVCSSIVIPPASDKLGDMKLKKPAGDLLISLAEKSSLQFVLSQAYDPMTKQKAPKAQADSFLWLDGAIRDFGMQGLSVHDLIEFLKFGLKSTNAMVRTNATKALVTLKLYVGTSISDLIQNLNPTLLATIDVEFNRVDGQQPPEPTRTSQDFADARPAGKGAGNQQASNDPMDELFPRVDIEKLISNSIIVACNDPNWKVRKEALESVQAIVEAGKRFKSTLGDLSSVLKLRIADSNKVVQSLAFDIIKRLAAGMERPFERYCKTLVPPIILVLADQKATTRQQAISVLTVIADACSLDGLVSSVATSLENANPALRKEALIWLAERDDAGAAELASLIAPLLSCLEDRSADVRKAAMQLLPIVIASAGFQAVHQQASSLKPASRALVLPLVEAMRPGGASQTLARPALSTASSSAASSRPASVAGKPLSKSLAPTPSAQSQNAGPASPLTKQPFLPSSMQTRLIRRIPSKTQSHASESELEPTTQEALLKTADQRFKSQRAAKEQGPLRWQVDGLARPEQVEFMHQQMMPHISGSLMDLLFSTDHHSDRDHLAALTLLDDCLLGHAPSIPYYISTNDMKLRWLANLDLLLKYLTIRLSDSATTIVLKCLDFIEHIAAFLSEERYFLSDYEANCCLPALIAKLGDPKEVLRGRVRGLIKSFSTIYPASKIFNNFLDYGLVSKNARTRAESADEIHMLIQRHGLSVCVLSRTMPLLAGLVGDKDPAARNAALQAISATYGLEGDAIMIYFKGLSEKHQGLLNERLKRTPGTSKADSQARMRTTRLSDGAARDRAVPMPVSVSTLRPQQGVDVRLAGITNPNEAIAVEALKLIHKDITTRPSTVLAIADSLVQSLVQQMNVAFTELHAGSDPATLRLCKHLMQTLSGLFDDSLLSKAVSQEALVSLLAEMTRRLLETAEEASTETIASLSKVLNMVLIRIFHNASKNASVGALFVILENVTADLRQLQGAELDARAKYAELVMKCLWKISKTAQNGLQDGSLDLEKLLHDIDRFLTTIAPAEWRRRASDSIPLGDMPLRTCKTILSQAQHVMSADGGDVYSQLDAMDFGEGSFVGAYIRRLAGNNSSSSSAHQPAEVRRTASTTTSLSRGSDPLSLSGPSARSGIIDAPQAAKTDDRELNQRLKDIFDAVGQPDKSKQGILALYDFRQAHPEAEPRIQTWIEATGRHFKAYLERAMANIAAEQQQKQPARTSVPVSPTTTKAASFDRPSQTVSTASVGLGAPSDRLQSLQSLFGFQATAATAI